MKLKTTPVPTKFVLKLCLLATGLLWGMGARAEVVPAARLANWQAGVTVGVPGGMERFRPGGANARTNILNVVTLYGADNTGATNAQPAIQGVINDLAQAGDVVYLPAGTYRLDYGVSGKSNITIRGAGTGMNGEPLTLIDYRGTGGPAFTVGTSFDFGTVAPPYVSANIIGSPVKGATAIEVDANTFAGIENSPHLGKLFLKNDVALPVVSTGGYERLRSRMVRIVSTSGSSHQFLHIAPPLEYDLPIGLQPQLCMSATQITDWFGLEDLKVDAAHSDINNGSPIVSLSGCYGSWLYNVAVINAPHFHISCGTGVYSEIRHCYAKDRQLVNGLVGQGGAALIVGCASGWLFEDNILLDQFPHIEVNAGTTGCVFAYNFCNGNNVNGVMGASIDTSHGPLNNFNLYEGNISSKLQQDGYFGGAAYDTLFRNWFHGTCAGTDQTGVCIDLKRFTRYYNIVGNILGHPSPQPGAQYPTYLLNNLNGATGLWDGTGSQRYIYNFGLPNIGNGGYYSSPAGVYAQPSVGKWWYCWDGTPMVRRGPFVAGTVYNNGDVIDQLVPAPNGPDYAGTNGILNWIAKDDSRTGTANWPNPYDDPAPWRAISPNSFQQIDLDVVGTALLKGNYNYATKSIPPVEELEGNLIANSLFRSIAPAYFGTLAWPPFDPSHPNPSFEAIPAGYRYLHGTDPASIGDQTPPTAPQNVVTVENIAARISLSWSASTDDSGVAGYRVERSRETAPNAYSLVAMRPVTNFSDTSVIAGTTYNYRIQALDLAGNRSEYSSVASISAGPQSVRPTKPGKPRIIR